MSITRLEEIKKHMDGIAMNPQPTDLHLIYREDVEYLLDLIERITDRINALPDRLTAE